MQEPPTWVRYRVMLWLSVAAVLGYFCRNSLGVAESTIRGELKIEEHQTGWYIGAFFWTYALFQIPAGYLGKKYGTRLVLGISGLAWSAAILLTGMAPNLEMLIAAQALMGLAQAGIFPCAVQSVSVWIPESNRASACAALTVGMQLGAIATAVLTAQFIVMWDWRMVFTVYAIPGILWAIAFLMMFINHPDSHESLNQAERNLITGASLAPPVVRETEPTPWRRILTSRSVICLCGQQMFRASAYSFFATWFPTFLQETRDVKIDKSGLFQGIVFAGSLFGGLYGGTLVDAIYKRTNNLRLSRSGVGVGCMLGCSLLIFAAYFAESVNMAVFLIGSGAFVAALAGPCAYVTTIDLGKQHVPAVFGLMNMLGNLAAAATPVVIGYLFEFTSNWNIVLVLFGITYILAAICWAFVNAEQSLESQVETKELEP